MKKDKNENENHIEFEWKWEKPNKDPIENDKERKEKNDK